MTNFQRTAAWLKACGKTPGVPLHLSVQIGCHIEELVEFLDCLTIRTPGGEYDHDAMSVLNAATARLEAVASSLKSGKTVAFITDEDRVDALDALCDAEVTGNGVAYLAGFMKDEADRAVLESNDAKLVNGKPVIKEGGKIGKPEGWTPPSLSSFV